MEDIRKSEDKQQQTDKEDQNNKKKETQNDEVGFNWKLPLFGAIGFGGIFALICAIGATNYNIVVNAWERTLSNSPKVGIETSISRGIKVGMIGGGILGLAFKNKIHALYFALTGAIGFSVAFSVVISLDPNVIPDLGRTIIKGMGGPEILSSFETSLAHGLGAGAIVGAIGGLVLGLASTKGRIWTSLLLCLVGAIWFANAFAFETIIEDPLCYRYGTNWNGWGGAIGGALFGLTLAVYYKMHDKIYLRQK